MQASSVGVNGALEEAGGFCSISSSPLARTLLKLVGSIEEVIFSLRFLGGVSNRNATMIGSGLTGSFFFPRATGLELGWRNCFFLPMAESVRV